MLRNQVNYLIPRDHLLLTVSGMHRSGGIRGIFVRDHVPKIGPWWAEFILRICIYRAWRGGHIPYRYRDLQLLCTPQLKALLVTHCWWYFREGNFVCRISLKNLLGESFWISLRSLIHVTYSNVKHIYSLKCLINFNSNKFVC